MLIADTHSDTLFAMGVGHADKAKLMITPERLREGGVTLQTFALWTGPRGNQGDVDGITAAELAAGARCWKLPDCARWTAGRGEGRRALLHALHRGRRAV